MSSLAFLIFCLVCHFLKQLVIGSKSEEGFDNHLLQYPHLKTKKTEIKPLNDIIFTINCIVYASPVACEFPSWKAMSVWSV